MRHDRHFYRMQSISIISNPIKMAPVNERDVLVVDYLLGIKLVYQDKTIPIDTVQVLGNMEVVHL